MRASSKRFMSILISALMFIAAIFVYSSFISPAYSDIKNLRAELVTRSQMADDQQSAIKQIQSLLKQYQNISSIENTIAVMLPLSQDAASSLSQITGLAAVNNLKLESLSVNRMASRSSGNQNLVKGVGILRFAFQLSGSYGNFKSFIKAMETNISLMDLVDLKIESSQGSKLGGDNLSFSVSADTYYQTE